MKRRIVFTVGLTLLVIFVRAQEVQEWTAQKKTQLNYLIEQIAAFQAYADCAAKGYSIAKDGLNMIHTIKKSDFALHNAHFNSLEKVNPTLKHYWKIAEIIALQMKTLQIYKNQHNQLKQSDLLTPDEKNYCLSVLGKILDGCNDIINQLTLLTTEDGVQMDDAARIKRIDALYTDIKDKYWFLSHFNQEVQLLNLQRLKEGKELQELRGLYGMH